MNKIIILLVIFVNSFSGILKFLLAKPDIEKYAVIRKVGTSSNTKVDRYWCSHTIFALKWNSAFASKLYYQWLINYYSPMEKLMEYDSDFTNKVVLDYGCGTGNDFFRLTTINKAKKVIGIDISYKALDTARRRLAVCGVDKNRCEFLHIADSTTTLPLENNSIDFVNCAGVLMHVTHPQKILKEFCRILKKGGTGIVMVYNYESIHLHLYVAYFQMILKGKYKGLSVSEAFSKTTDGEDCPIVRCYKPKEFIKLCEKAGFKAEYRGGYFSPDVLGVYHKYWQKALKDKRLSNYHKQFLRSLTVDADGYPKYNGYYTGVHGVYKISKK